MEDANLTWTMSMAFYALSGGCVYSSHTGELRILRKPAIVYLVKHEPERLLQLQRVILQKPGKANAIGKAITCVQAIWFCAQCIARLRGNLAVSLAELNTFAHCISTLLIYVFWWDKPYDVETHVFVESRSLDVVFLSDLTVICSVTVAIPHLTPGPHHCYLYDSYGRILMNMDTICKRQRNDEMVPLALGCRKNVSGTGFYVSLVDRWGEVITQSIALDIGTQGMLEDMWIAWTNMDQPIPVKEVSPRWGNPWYYSHTSGSPDMDTDLVEDFKGGLLDLRVCVIMTLTFIVYGGLHLLAWHYNFNSRSEQYLWRMSAVIIAAGGLILFTLYTADQVRYCEYRFKSPRTTWNIHMYKACDKISRGLIAWVPYLFMLLNVASRAFLVTESFIALPNSARSTYTIPRWTSYIPHI